MIKNYNALTFYTPDGRTTTYFLYEELKGGYEVVGFKEHSGNQISVMAKKDGEVKPILTSCGVPYALSDFDIIE